MTDQDKYEAAKDASRASAKPEEWCGYCDDWSANCEACSDEDIRESLAEREDEAKWQAGDDEGYDHDRGVCDGPGCCRYCDTLPGREPRKPAFKLFGEA